jgi:hypothetical protein
MLTVQPNPDTIRYMAKYRKQDMRDLMAVLKALADENRVRILGAVHHRELCVCQIVELLGLAQSTVSKHLDSPSGQTGGKPQRGAMDVLPGCGCRLARRGPPDGRRGNRIAQRHAGS